MLETVDLKACLEKSAFKRRMLMLERRLAPLQQRARVAGLPVVVLLEGLDMAGKGRVLGRLLEMLDRRGVSVAVAPAGVGASGMPLPQAFWDETPARGRFTIYCPGWYRLAVERARAASDPDQALVAQAREAIEFERWLTDAGFLVVKFFLHLSKGDQARRLEQAARESKAARRLLRDELRRHRDYKAYRDAFDRLLDQTSTAAAPWTVVAARDRRHAEWTVAQVLTERLEAALAVAANTAPTPAPDGPVTPRRVRALPTAGRAVSDAVYRKRLAKGQKRLGDLQTRLRAAGRRMVIVYEGWDAAGKGGNIRRLAAALDPRACAVVPIAAPSDEERARHYLWRFWRRLPAAGQMVIFDRSWYGRVLVERVEGFCRPADWRRAYAEIAAFERQLRDHGVILVKFWLSLSSREQLRRFHERERLPYKRWKITPEDWRNRARWKEYSAAVHDMLTLTSTPNAPWCVIPADNKHSARLTALETVTRQLKAELDT